MISVFKNKMTKKYSFFFKLSLLFLIVQNASAQYDQSSYSIIGLGNLNWGGYSHNAGMAGLGLTYNSKFFLNNTNPALAASNYEAVFQAGATLDYRGISNNTNTYTSSSGGLKIWDITYP